jgi:hypothetical protein
MELSDSIVRTAWESPPLFRAGCDLYRNRAIGGHCMLTQLNRNIGAELTDTIRDASGMLHTIGQHVTVVKRSETLGREMFLVQFADNSFGYVYPQEIELINN